MSHILVHLCSLNKMPKVCSFIKNKNIFLTEPEVEKVEKVKVEMRAPVSWGRLLLPSKVAVLYHQMVKGRKARALPCFEPFYFTLYFMWCWGSNLGSCAC